MKQGMSIVDVVVVGGGPAGLFTAFYAGLRGLSAKIIESLPQLGGQLSALYPEKYIYDVAGFPQVRAQDLVNNLVEQTSRFNPEVCLDETVEMLERSEDGVYRLTTNKSVHLTRAVILAAGVGAFEPKKPPISGIEEYEGKGVVYAVPEKNKLAGHKVLVAGGGDSAVDWALMLEDVAASVSLVHRRDGFRAHEENVRQLHESSVQVLTPYEILALHGDEKLAAVSVRNKETDEEERLAADTLVVSFGFQSTLGKLAEWGLELDNRAIKVDAATLETSLPGVYAVGDCAIYPGKLPLIAIGFGEAQRAVAQAKHFINPDEKVKAVHSSNLKLA